MKKRISMILISVILTGVLSIITSAQMPLEMSAERGNGDSWTISLENISQENKSDISLRVCFYDKSGRLEKVKSYGEADIDKGETAQFLVALPSMDFVYANTVRAIAWKDTEPQANEIYLKGEKIIKAFTDEETAYILISASNGSVYKNGAEHTLHHPIHETDDEIYLSARDISEMLELNVEWDGEEQTLILYSDEHFYGGVIDDITGFYNGAWIEMEASPIIENGTVMVPFGMIAGLFGCEITKIGDKVMAFDEMSLLVRNMNESGLIPEKFKGKMISEELTRGELCSLVVRIYEKIKNEPIQTEDIVFLDTDDEDVLKAVSLGVINGFEDGRIRPESYITRGEAAYVLYKTMIALGVEIPEDYSSVAEFKDVEIGSGHWAEEYIYRIKGIGVMDGVFRNSFCPDAGILRKEAIALAANCYSIAK